MRGIDNEYHDLIVWILKKEKFKKIQKKLLF